MEVLRITPPKTVFPIPAIISLLIKKSGKLLVEYKKLNRKLLNFINSISFTLLSNLISLLISTLVILIVPRLIGVEEYGYWQLYIFYSSFVGFLHFGWNDGIYLRFGGKEYKDLNKNTFFSQFYMLAFLQSIFAVITFAFSFKYAINSNRIFIFQTIAVYLLLFNTRSMLLFILLATNRIKEYAKITIIDRIIYICIIIIFLIIGLRDYRLLIVSDLVSKIFSLSYAMFCCKDIVFRNISNFHYCFSEAFMSVSAGIKLMFANIASMLIIGVVRFGIERSWNVATFGKISLMLSVSNLMMLFINAVGIVMFPILRRTNENKLANIYSTIRDIMMMILLGILIIYYPIKVVLSAWLPKYSESLSYMVLVFPMSVYEGKMALLINTYLKTLRKENIMLKINLISFLLSIVITILSTVILKSLYLALLSIVILLAFRCILAEVLLSKILNISMYKDIVSEVVITIIFVLLGWFVNSWISVMTYVMLYVAYLFMKKKDIVNSIKNIQLLMSPSGIIESV